MSKNYKDILNKFSDLSNHDITMISMTSYSRGNISSASGHSFLKGNNKKEEEINFMMNLVEEFLGRFEENPAPT